MASLLRVEQAVRVVVEVLNQDALQLKVLIEEKNAAFPAIDDQQATVWIKAHMCEVVQVVGSAEYLEILAGSVELSNLEHLGAVDSPTPVTDDDGPVFGLHGVTRFHSSRQHDLPLQSLFGAEDEQHLRVERNDQDSIFADRQRVGTHPAAKHPPCHRFRRSHLPYASNTVWLVDAAVRDEELIRGGTDGDVIWVIHVGYFDVFQTLEALCTGIEHVDDWGQFTDRVQQTFEYCHSTNYTCSKHTTDNIDGLNTGIPSSFLN